MPTKFSVDPDIRKAETLPSDFYKEEAVFTLSKSKIFNSVWHWFGDEDLVQLNGQVMPFEPLDGFLEEPMLLTRTREGLINCISNVCTHRGNLLIPDPRSTKKLICNYHGRRFDLEGRFEYMPEFDEAENFPRACDHLKKFPLISWKKHLFTGIDPQFPLESFLTEMDKRVGYLPIDEFALDKSRSREYLVNAHWALYCDNFLEGFHIPFVHEDLKSALDYGKYKTDLFEFGNLQTGYSSGGIEVFDLPQGHIDYGSEVAAYYFWLFPNMMFNFYPWGLSINIVKPLSRQKSRVSFITYMYDESKIGKSAGALLDKVEREDEFVVESVQKGLNSGAYTTGRYSPTRETGVHHFHRLIARFMND